jgi:hypothetical protein
MGFERMMTSGWQLWSRFEVAWKQWKRGENLRGLCGWGQLLGMGTGGSWSDTFHITYLLWSCYGAVFYAFSSH